MNPFTNIAHTFANYFNFRGRATRAEYWYFLFFKICAVILTVAAADYFYEPVNDPHNVDRWFFTIAIVIVLLIIPHMSVGVRRLHDAGLSGWWLLIAIVPILGALVLIVLFCMPSREERIANPNKRPSAAYDDRRKRRDEFHTKFADPHLKASREPQRPTSILKTVNPFTNIASAFSNYYYFHGRATRSEYWYFAAFNYALFALAIFAVPIVLTMPIVPGDIHQPRILSNTGIIVTALFLFLFVPNLSVAVRRLHDIGFTSGPLLWAIAAPTGYLALLIVFCLPSQTDCGSEAHAGERSLDQSSARSHSNQSRRMDLTSLLGFVVDPFYQCLDFRGRATRSEFWWFSALSIVFFVAWASVCDSVLHALYTFGRSPALDLALNLASVAPLLLFPVAGFSLCIRRLHDAGLSGWWILVGLIPSAAYVLALFTMLASSTHGANPLDEWHVWVFLAGLLLSGPLALLIMCSKATASHKLEGQQSAIRRPHGFDIYRATQRGEPDGNRQFLRETSPEQNQKLSTNSVQHERSNSFSKPGIDPSRASYQGNSRKTSGGQHVRRVVNDVTRDPSVRSFTLDQDRKWEHVTEFFPEVAVAYRNLQDVSPELAAGFRSEIMITQEFNSAHALEGRMLADFSRSNFGTSEDLQRFGCWCLRNHRSEVAVELSEIVGSFDTSAMSAEIIERLCNRHGLQDYTDSHS